MTVDVLTFSPDDTVDDAIRRLVDRGVDGAPVLDGDGKVVGLLTTDDLIVSETQLHLPTVLSIFGGTIELPGSQRRFEEELQRAVGSKVGDLMHDDPPTCGPDDTIEEAATRMHDHHAGRLPVVDDAGRLVGIVARGDILRSIVADRSAPGDGVVGESVTGGGVADGGAIE